MTRFDTGSRTQLLVDMTLDFDPTGSTVEVEVDGTWYAATWIGSPVSASGRWMQTARTTAYFAGPAHAAPAGATVLATGRRYTQTRVTASGTTIVFDSTPIDVK